MKLYFELNIDETFESPIKIASALIETLEVDREYHTALEMIEEVAEHLLVYCKHVRNCEKVE